MSLIAAALPLAASPPLAASSQPATTALSPRNASYSIEARLDPATHEITGTEQLTWRNLQRRPTHQLWFHLYWNAFRNDQSTWLLEDGLRGRSDLGHKVQEDDWGYCQVQQVTLLAGPADGAAETAGSPATAEEGIDLTGTLHYEAPDDGNPQDRTVVVVDLPQPVEPGETVRVALEWRSRVPRTFARTGRRGEFYLIAHWFPKLGVYEEDGWNCHQFHANTEFFSDYGVYDVRLTVPQRFVVGATGTEVEVAENADGTSMHRFVQEDVHGFTWTASPDYLVREQRFEEAGLLPVDIRLLLQPEHLGQAQRHFDATAAALKYYGKWYGPYPYGHVTVVDPAYGSGAGGMEYPTLFTAGTRLFNPFGGGSPEGVTIHEAGHQFWYGLVGNNEFENAWIDEGLNTFSTARTYEAAYGERRLVKRYLVPPGTDFGGFLPVLFNDVRYERMVQGNRWNRYIASRAPTADAESVPSFLYYPPASSRITYDKTALWLSTLENFLGWETLQRILSTFFERAEFRHPTPEEFFAIAQEVSGRDLSWFFDEVYWRSVTFDYAVASATSRPAVVKGLVEQDGEFRYQDGDAEEDEATALYRSEVVVRRYGEGTFPVDVLMIFEDGSEVRRSWEGKDRWKLFVQERPSKLDYAVVDPDRVLLLDLDFANNSRLREPAPGLPATKWASKWMIWLQDLLAMFTFYV